MSINIITGSLEGTLITGSFGQLYALTDSRLELYTTTDTASFTLPRGNVFGMPALNGSTPFPNEINTIKVYGQGEIVALTTTATGGGGGTGSAEIPTGSLFLNELQIGPVTSSAADTWRITTSGSALAFEYWDTLSSSWITDTYLNGTPYSGSGNIVSASYALTSSYVPGGLTFDNVIAGPNITINTGSGLFEISGSGGGGIADTGSLVSNVVDTYTSVPSASYIVTLTAAEYASIPVPESNIVYIVI